MSLEDDEALFEDLYGDDEKQEEKQDTIQKEVEKETTVSETAPASAPASASGPAPATENDSSAQNKTTTEGESETVPPPPPPPPPPSQPVPSNGDVNAQYNTTQDVSNATPTAPTSVPAGMPQFPFDPAQFQQYAAANGLQFPGNTTSQQNFDTTGGVPPPPPVPAPVPAPAPGPAASTETAGGPSRKCFIGGLSWDTTEEALVSHFQKYGNIVDYTIMKDSATGRSRGFGFLTFEDAKSVDALLKDRHVLDGKLIDPKRAISKEDQEKVGKIFVGGIDPMVTEEEFDNFFSQFGKIIDCQLMIDKDTGRSRGFGFVTYDSPAAVDKVCVNKYLTLKGKAMEVKRAAPRGQHNQQVMMQQQQQQQAQQAQQQQAQQQAMYPYGSYGFQQMNAGTMNPAMSQEYMRYYQWFMYQQAQAAQQQQQQQQQQLATLASPEAQPAQPLNPQQQAAEEESEKSEEPPRPAIPTGPKRAPPTGPSYRGGGRGGGRGGYRRGRGYHPYSRGGRR